MPHATLQRILFIDAYDSFTNNIISLLETNLCVKVTTIKIDEPIPHFLEFLKPFSAVVAGPGPGDPRNSKDVGWFRELWKLEGENILPILGICLGFQSLVLAFGGTVDRLREPRHGVVRRVRTNGAGTFRGLDEVDTVHYHSLYASLGSDDKQRTGSCDSGDPPLKYPDLVPLAWDYEMDNARNRTEEAVPSQRILMAVEHKSKPFFGIQFHAESICSSINAGKVIESWWEMAKRWKRPGRDSHSLPSPPQSPNAALEMGSRDEQESPGYRGAVRTPSKSIDDVGRRAKRFPFLQEDVKGYDSIHPSARKIRKLRVKTRAINVGEATIPSICEALSLTDGEVIILDSELHQRHDVGKYSIIGLVSANSLRLEYQVGTHEVRQTRNGHGETIDLRHYGGSIFQFLKVFMSQYEVERSNKGVPFWGGLMGFIGYEACLETIGINHSHACTGKAFRTPDLSFVFIERSIVIDHLQKDVHVQTIKPDDQDWVDKTISQLRSPRCTAVLSTTLDPASFNAQISRPGAASYQSKVRACQSAIRAGDSYELCLTSQSTVHTQNRLTSWPLYLRLRSLNSAPFSAYVRLGKLTVLSSSPERFLQWSRPTEASDPGTNDAMDLGEKTISCQFRPIKGTVRRQPDPNLPPLTLAEATALLATPKERAENLMIVDLIRHDLHGVVGSGRVNVPKLMVVEEYATLFQLVSVVEGSLVIGDDDDGINNKTPPRNPPAKSGLDILAASLPPGSMTGAPKLRSCQILRSLEPHPRGVYSGVLGYLDVGGGGDFSVVIRTAVRWDRPTPDDSDDLKGGEDVGEETTGDGWSIGAGGAVTGLSTEEGEWEEMLAKLRSTIRLFE